MRSSVMSVALLAALFFAQTTWAGSTSGRVIGWGGVTEPAIVTGAGLTNICMVAAGTYHSLALTKDGVVIGAGNNNFKEVTGVDSAISSNGIVKVNGEVLSNVVSIVAGNSWSLALKKDGTLAAWGQMEVPADVSNVVAISAATTHALAVKRDGTIVAFGGGRTPIGLSNAVSVAAGKLLAYWDAALLKDGTVAEWNIRYPQPEGPLVSVTNDDGTIEKGYRLHEYHMVKGLSNVVAIAAGQLHKLALLRNGTVFSWQVALNTNNVSFSDVPDGDLVKIKGELLTNVVAIDANIADSFTDYGLALKKDGSVVTWCNNPRPFLNPPANLTNVIGISAGVQFCLAVTTDNVVTNLSGAQQPPK